MVGRWWRRPRGSPRCRTSIRVFPAWRRTACVSSTTHGRFRRCHAMGCPREGTAWYPRAVRADAACRRARSGAEQVRGVRRATAYLHGAVPQVSPVLRLRGGQRDRGGTDLGGRWRRRRAGHRPFDARVRPGRRSADAPTVPVGAAGVPACGCGAGARSGAGLAGPGPAGEQRRVSRVGQSELVGSGGVGMRAVAPVGGEG